MSSPVALTLRTLRPAAPGALRALRAPPLQTLQMRSQPFRARRRLWRGGEEVLGRDEVVATCDMWKSCGMCSIYCGMLWHVPFVTIFKIASFLDRVLALDLFDSSRNCHSSVLAMPSQPSACSHGTASSHFGTTTHRKIGINPT